MMLWLGKEGEYQSANLEPLKGANWYIVDLPVFELTEGVKLYFSGGHTTRHMTLAVKTNRDDPLPALKGGVSIAGVLGVSPLAGVNGLIPQCVAM